MLPSQSSGFLPWDSEIICMTHSDSVHIYMGNRPGWPHTWRHFVMSGHWPFMQHLWWQPVVGHRHLLAPVSKTILLQSKWSNVQWWLLISIKSNAMEMKPGFHDDAHYSVAVMCGINYWSLYTYLAFTWSVTPMKATTGPNCTMAQLQPAMCVQGTLP